MKAIYENFQKVEKNNSENYLRKNLIGMNNSSLFFAHQVNFSQMISWEMKTKKVQEVIDCEINKLQFTIRLKLMNI